LILATTLIFGMYKFTDTPIKQRIASYRRGFQKELDTVGMISDLHGKRYVLFRLYFLLNEPEDSADYFEWFEEQFPNDMGEPIMYLCWAVMLRRMNRIEEAKRKLVLLMLSNIYFIPLLLDDNSVTREAMWHGSNRAEMDYFEELPNDIIQKLSLADLEWIEAQYLTAEFKRIRKTHIAIYKGLLREKDMSKRSTLAEMSTALWRSLSGKSFDRMNN